MVEDHERRVDLARGTPDLGDLAAAREESWIGAQAAALDERVAHGAGAMREPYEFLNRVGMRHIAEVQADEDRGLRIQAGRRTL